MGSFAPCKCCPWDFRVFCLSPCSTDQPVEKPLHHLHNQVRPAWISTATPDCLPVKMNNKLTAAARWTASHLYTFITHTDYRDYSDECMTLSGETCTELANNSFQFKQMERVLIQLYLGLTVVVFLIHLFIQMKLFSVGLNVGSSILSMSESWTWFRNERGIILTSASRTEEVKVRSVAP